jgi:pilus assembly protein CpaF
VTVTEELILPLFAGMGLDKHLLDPEVSELMVNNGLAFIDKQGAVVELPGIHIEARKLQAVIEIVAQGIGDHIDDYQKPWLDARLPDGSRVAAAYPPISPQGITLTIRKFLRHFTTEELVERGALCEDSLRVLLDAIDRRRNVVFAGGTSTGKTTQLNAFVRHIDGDERIVTIEKPVEMKLTQRNVVRLEAVPAVGDRPEVTMSQLLSMTLRHRPDRIIVGEVKDSEAAFGLLQAMNTGHDGTVSTIHANTAASALTRLASLAMPGFGSLDLSRQEVAAAIDLVVETKRLRGWRGVSSILEVRGYDERNRVFETAELYRRVHAEAA